MKQGKPVFLIVDNFLSAEQEETIKNDLVERGAVVFWSHDLSEAKYDWRQNCTEIDLVVWGDDYWSDEDWEEAPKFFYKQLGCPMSKMMAACVVSDVKEAQSQYCYYYSEYDIGEDCFSEYVMNLF